MSLAADPLISDLSGIVGGSHVLAGAEVPPEYTRDEALTVEPVFPRAVVSPANTEEVSRLLAYANRKRLPIVTRGAGTGLSGGCTPMAASVVLSLERLDRVLEIDDVNQVAVCQPFVRLSRLYAVAAAHDLTYAIMPGESSATVGGNVNTNAGGMQAIKYGVTRHHVVGLEAVLADGQVLRTGGKFAKASSGYDLSQLIVGSEGTLAVVTEVTLRLVPRLPHRCTLLAPFRKLDEVTRSIPKLVATGLGPLMLEYIDGLTMRTILQRSQMTLGVDSRLQAGARAYLLIVTEGRGAEAAERDAIELGQVCVAMGAIDAFLLPPQAGARLIEAREKGFWAAKNAGAGDVVDVVVPRASLALYIERVGAIAAAHQALVAGCGHAGDGNVHLAVFHRAAEVRRRVTTALLQAGLMVGGAISGEHGIGRAKKDDYAALEDPAKLALQRRIKHAFDPNGILNPGVIFDGFSA